MCLVCLRTAPGKVATDVGSDSLVSAGHGAHGRQALSVCMASGEATARVSTVAAGTKTYAERGIYQVAM